MGRGERFGPFDHGDAVAREDLETAELVEEGDAKRTLGGAEVEETAAAWEEGGEFVGGELAVGAELVVDGVFGGFVHFAHFDGPGAGNVVAFIC